MDGAPANGTSNSAGNKAAAHQRGERLGEVRPVNDMIELGRQDDADRRGDDSAQEQDRDKKQRAERGGGLQRTCTCRQEKRSFEQEGSEVGRAQSPADDQPATETSGRQGTECQPEIADWSRAIAAAGTATIVSPATRPTPMAMITTVTSPGEARRRLLTLLCHLDGAPGGRRRLASPARLRRALCRRLRGSLSSGLRRAKCPRPGAAR